MKTSVAAAIDRAKREIIEDIAAGRHNRHVNTFSELHDNVDANEYGGLTEDGVVCFCWLDDLEQKRLHEGPLEAPCDRCGATISMDEANDIQDALDAWLKAGRPES